VISSFQQAIYHFQPLNLKPLKFSYFFVVKAT